MAGICVKVAVAFRGWTPEYSGGAPLKAPTYDYDDGTVDEVYRFRLDPVLPVTPAQLGVKNVTPEALNTIAEVAINNGIHAELMMVVTRDTIERAIVTADSLGKRYLEGKRLV